MTQISESLREMVNCTDDAKDPVDLEAPRIKSLRAVLKALEVKRPLYNWSAYN